MQVIKNKTQKIVIISIFLVFASLATLIKYNQTSSLETNPLVKVDEKIKQADISWTYDLTGGAGIYIDDSDPSNDWSTNVAYDWIEGGGTLGNPYEIKNVLFDGEARNMNLITIKNSIAHFRIEECILINTAEAYWDRKTSGAIYLEDVENGIISNVNTSNCNNGIRLVNSEFNRIQGVFASNNHYSAIAVSGGSNNRIKNTTVTGSGIILEDGTFNNDVLENIITTSGYEEDGIILSSSNYNNITFNIISELFESSGISLSASDYNNISGNAIHNRGIGLKIDNSDYNFVSANLIVNSTDPWKNAENYDPDYNDHGFGLLISSSSLNTIFKNDISICEFFGIYIDDCNNHSIWENTVSNSGLDDIHLVDTPYIDMALNEMIGSGLYFDFFGNNLTGMNIETSNLVNGKPIYYYANQSGLSSGDFINAGQIYLLGCNDILISGLEFDLVTTGITMVYCFSSIISLNEASDNSRWAFSLTNCNYNIIRYNDVIRSRIILKNSDYNKFIENSASYSKTDGVSFDDCNNNHISGNTATYNNENGIRLFKTNHGLIHNNSANNNNETGISMKGRLDYWDPGQCINNTLTSNEANDNGDIGIDIEYIHDIVITGNTANRNIEGISLNEFNLAIITKNEVISNEHGITLTNGWDAYVNNNTANSNIEFWGSGTSFRSGEGILISDCFQLEVNYNIINRNAQGIILSNCSTSDVKYNYLSENGKEEPSFLFTPTQEQDTGIIISYSTSNNVSENILNENGIGLSNSRYNSLYLNKITGFGFIIEISNYNIISRNDISAGLIAIDLYSSSHNEITFNIIVAQQCFRETGSCISNIFEDNDCTEVLPEFFLPEIISLIGIASVLGINIPLFIKKQKNRK